MPVLFTTPTITVDVEHISCLVFHKNRIRTVCYVHLIGGQTIKVDEDFGANLVSIWKSLPNSRWVDPNTLRIEKRV